MLKTITSINFEEAKNLIDQTNGLIVILGLAGSGKSKLADICKYDTYLDFENVDKENHLRLNKEIKIPELKNKYGHTLAIKDYMDKCYDYYNIICYGTTVIDTVSFLTRTDIKLSFTNNAINSKLVHKLSLDRKIIAVVQAHKDFNSEDVESIKKIESILFHNANLIVYVKSIDNVQILKSNKMSKCVHDNNGICGITAKPCEDTVICTPETVYIDKEDSNGNKN